MIGLQMDLAAESRLALDRGPETKDTGAVAFRLSANAAMDRYADGDDSAFDALYDALAPRLYKYLLRQTRDRGRAEDLLQQTMLKLHTTRGRFLRGADVVPWAFAIARRTLIDSIRARKREAEANADPVAALETETGSSALTDELLHSLRLARKVETELSRLPEPQRVAFELIRNEGLSVRDVAQILGTTANAVKLRAHRAYVALRAAIADEADGK
jgi:RNA polymerase sigma-70 factor (ECF subfamily)